MIGSKRVGIHGRAKKVQIRDGAGNAPTSGGNRMRRYVMTTGTVFGLLALVHLWRAIEEGAHLATDPWFLIITVVAGALSAWAFRLVRLAPKA